MLFKNFLIIIYSQKYYLWLWTSTYTQTCQFFRNLTIYLQVTVTQRYKEKKFLATDSFLQRLQQPGLASEAADGGSLSFCFSSKCSNSFWIIVILTGVSWCLTAVRTCILPLVSDLEPFFCVVCWPPVLLPLKNVHLHPLPVLISCLNLDSKAKILHVYMQILQNFKNIYDWNTSSSKHFR